MENKKFIEVVEDHFNVHELETGVELEEWTDGGVNMFIDLSEDNNKSYLQQFKEYIDNFDIDEEIEIHRQDEQYKNDFTIRESVEDFESYHRWLNEVYSTIE